MRDAGSAGEGSCRCGTERSEEELILIVDAMICGYIRREGDDLSMRHIGILVQISQQPMDITPLATALGLSLSTVSRSIDALEKLKLARRERNGRNVTVHVTPLGAAKVGRIMATALDIR